VGIILAHIPFQVISEDFKPILKTFWAPGKKVIAYRPGKPRKEFRTKGEKKMKSRILTSIYGMALMSVLIPVGMVTLTPARAVKAGHPERPGNSESRARKLERTWRVQITIRDCQTGAALGNPFPALITFARGGTLTSADTRLSPGVRSPGLGVWRHTGGHAYSAVTEAFLFSPAGVWIGTQRITQVIEIGEDPDEFNANASTEFLDPSGNPIPGFPPSTVCSTSVGHRME
jgi:hypothetical protein